MHTYTYPKSFPRARELDVYVDGKAIDVLRTNVAYFASVEFHEPVQVEIRCAAVPKAVKISPVSKKMKSESAGNIVRFRLDEPQHLHIAIGGLELPLFFYGNRESAYDGQATYFYAAGQVYEAGQIELGPHESVYIEGGAIVKGSIRAYGAPGIKIYGNGILDGSYHQDVRDYRTILLHDCEGVTIRDIVMIHPPCWMIMLANCSSVHIDGVKQIGEVVSSDGIDIVGCHDVLVENCILRNNDDCVVIKSFDWAEAPGGRLFEASKDVYNVLVRGCTFVNGPSGNAIEIGHELTTDEVRDIRFEDIDIVSVHGYGAALSIHAGDRAAVRDVTFENIRIEHYYDKLVDFRVMKSMYNQDSERGRIHDIKVKDIFVTVAPYNPGYSISIIGGYDADHQVERVTFENFRLGDTVVTDANQMDLFMKEAMDIRFYESGR